MPDKHWSKGDVLQGTISSLDQQGAWVDVQGEMVFLPLAEISWFEIEHPSENLRTGQSVLLSVFSKGAKGIYEGALREVRNDEIGP